MPSEVIAVCVPPLMVGAVIVLLVSVCVASVPTIVVDASGQVRVRVLPVVMPESWKTACLVVSALSCSVNTSSLAVMVGAEKMPPVTVLPVKVSAAGSENVWLPETPLPLATVISLAVPVAVRKA
jgi:hypothetical protein